MKTIPKILIVEDQNIVAMDIQNRLKNLNYEVTGIASSGAGAIKKAEETQPDLVLMDIMLKGDMDGINAAEQIKKRYRIPVVYLTAYADNNTLQRAKITEPFGYILKPFEERELHTTIEMAIYRHKMEKQLKQREEWFETTLKCIAEAVITTDKSSRVSYLNPTAEKLTGWKLYEAVDKPLNEVFRIIYESNREEADVPSLKSFENNKSIDVPRRIILISKEGNERLISETVSPIKDENEEMVGLVLTFRDITEISRIEDELQKIQKLESIGILAGGIAHDFNNILTAIVGNISLAKLKLSEEHSVYELLGEAENAAFNARDLTQQLLTFSKGGIPVKKAINLKKLIEKTTRFSLRGSNVNYKFEIPEDLWSVEADESQINQVINNIVINAEQSMADGGCLTVKAENLKADDIDFSLPLKNIDYIKVSFQDEGSGILEKNINKIFDPYFTTKQKGSGLGLTISFSIISKHDGLITVNSKLSKGSVFCIYLPAAMNNEKVELPETENKPELIEKKILVMDDEEDILNLIDSILTDSGYHVELARDGRETLKIYQNSMENNDKFSLIIMDLTIPGGMGGKDTIVRIKEMDPSAKVIVCSGYSNDPIISNFREYGFIDALTKPFKLSELKKKVSNAMSP